jgi:hypothetical protein
MDITRAESYMRSICSVLDFDIGELWIASKKTDQPQTLKFLQLYISRDNEEVNRLAVKPNPLDPKDEDSHIVSPLVRLV